VLSFVFSLIVLSILGVIFGHVALKQIAERGEGGRGFAIAGLVIGYAGVAMNIVGIVILAATFGALAR